MTGLFEVTRATLANDLRLEWRSKDAINAVLFFAVLVVGSKDAINAVLFFAVLVVVMFSFSFEPNAEESRRIVGGLAWMAILFSAVVALNQAWVRELRNQVLDAYRVSPAPANALFLGKALANFLFVLPVEALMALLFVILYNLRPLGEAEWLILIFLLGTWALVVTGTFFATLSLRTRARELMLPLILFPFCIPAVLAMVSATTSVLTGEGSPRLAIQFLAVYDVVFTTVSLLLFESVLHAE